MPAGRGSLGWPSWPSRAKKGRNPRENPRRPNGHLGPPWAALGFPRAFARATSSRGAVAPPKLRERRREANVAPWQTPEGRVTLRVETLGSHQAWEVGMTHFRSHRY